MGFFTDDVTDSISYPPGTETTETWSHCPQCGDFLKQYSAPDGQVLSACAHCNWSDGGWH